MEYYKTIPGKYPNKKNENTEDEYFGKGWSVKKERGIYLLNYVSGSLQGELKSIKITKEDFELAKSGNMTLDQFCIKYNIT